jgi:hypothetical protein
VLLYWRTIDNGISTPLSDFSLLNTPFFIIKFVSDLIEFYDFLLVLWFHLAIKLTDTLYLKSERGVEIPLSVAVSFIGRGNQSTWRKPPTCTSH